VGNRLRADEGLRQATPGVKGPSAWLSLAPDLRLGVSCLTSPSFSGYQVSPSTPGLGVNRCLSGGLQMSFNPYLPHGFAVQTDHQVDSTVVRVKGELDMAGAESFRQQFLQGMSGMPAAR